MLSKKAMWHSTWDLRGALSDSDRTRQCAGATSPVLHGLVVDWHFSPRPQACSEPEIIIAGGGTTGSKTNIWTALTTRLNVTAPADKLDYRKVGTSEFQEFCAEERLCQGEFPLNAILPPPRAALAISIDECGLCFHQLEGSRREFTKT